MLTDVFGVMCLQGRLFAAAHMPNCQHFECFGCDAVVNEIPNATNQQAANAFDPGALVGSAEAGLLCQQYQGFADIYTNCTWCRWSIFGPTIQRP